MKSFRGDIKNQLQKKTNSFTDSRVAELQEEIVRLQNNLKETSSEFDIKEIKIVRNVRDNMVFQEIEDLAKDIELNGQLQPVLITSDKFLIAGHRRYYAIDYLNKNGIETKIIASKYSKSYNEIGKENFDKLQLSENEQRKNLDNFHLSDLFNEYLESGKSQKEIAEIFKRPKTKVSELISLKKIPDIIKDKLREIQYYGMTQKKFFAKNFTPESRVSNIIGVTPLYKIASAHESDQVKVFIELFASKIHKSDLIDLHHTKFTKLKSTSIDVFKKRVDKDFARFEKQYTDNSSKKIIAKAKEYKELMEKELNKIKE